MTLSITSQERTVSGRVGKLLTMLTYKRPAGSVTERLFVDRYIAPLGATPDGFGNMWLTIGNSPILWSSHTDTVHKTAGTQRILFGDDIATSDSGECLGADCTTGVWIMRQMIRAGVPGTYVFHRSEEVGCLGSSYVAQHERHRLEGIQFAIAFDRKGYNEIITHQFGERTASEAFAASFSLAMKPMKLASSDKGIVTDTASYAGIIPECTNISIGYDGGHTPKEAQHVGFATYLLDTLIQADFSGLVCQRDPDDYGFMDMDNDAYVVSDMAPLDLENFVYENPNIVADFLHECGYTADDLHLFARGRR